MLADTRPKMLFVGTDPIWHSVARQVAFSRGARLDVQPDVKSALAYMLKPNQMYEHVLAVAPLRSRAMDALAGMLDEVTMRPTPLLLLGCATSGTASPMECVHHPDVDAVNAALDAGRTPPLAGEPPMSSAELASTLHAGGLRMRFQPILRAADLEPIGLEALARLHHGQRGILHPKDFIPLTVACGRESVLAGIAAARTFLEIGALLRDADLFVTINLPLSTVMNEFAIRRGAELCAVAEVNPRQIMLEVLESSTAPDMDKLRSALVAWRKVGFRVAIDDAGPALPHWRAMLDLPFDALKLDGAMVKDPGQQRLLESIVREARAHGRYMVAEGVEDQACLDRVLKLGVDAVQGFMFSRPLPAMAVPIWLDHWSRVRDASAHALPALRQAH